LAPWQVNLTSGRSGSDYSDTLDVSVDTSNPKGQPEQPLLALYLLAIKAFQVLLETSL
jgi:hypothetical protein